MIIIEKPYIDATRMIIDISVDGESKSVFVEVEDEYKNYLCHERSDGILIGILQYAIRNRHDIKCKAPVTDELLYNIREILLPSLKRGDSRVYIPKIECQMSNALNCGGGGRNRLLVWC